MTDDEGEVPIPHLGFGPLQKIGSFVQQKPKFVKKEARGSKVDVDGGDSRLEPFETDVVPDWPSVEVEDLVEVDQLVALDEEFLKGLGDEHDLVKVVSSEGFTDTFENVGTHSERLERVHSLSLKSLYLRKKSFRKFVQRNKLTRPCA